MTSTASPKSAPGWKAAAYVLAFQSCLGFAYYGATANLVLLLQKYAGEDENAAESLTNYFGGVIGLTPLLGGFLSDRVMGGFRTILLGGGIFAASLALTTYAVHAHSRAVLMPTLFGLLPLGYGLLTSNMNVFGAHQFGDGEAKTSWFSWFYFSINIGSILAFLIPGMLQQSVSFVLGLAVPTGVLALGLLVFASAGGKFLHPSGAAEEEETPNAEDPCALAEQPRPDAGSCWRKIAPAMMLTILFSICYCQMQTTWYVQGLWMNRQLFGMEIPVSYMMCTDPLFVMLAIYALESLVFPRLRARGAMPEPVSRMALGMLFSCCGMYSAFLVERLRRQSAALDPTAVSPVSILAQIPQFAFVALAEVFVYTTIQDYAFSLAPASMKSTINATNLLSGALANVIAGVMTTACSSWIPPTNPNYGHYDRFYLLLGGLCLVGAAGFHGLKERAPLAAAGAQKAKYGAA